MEQEFAFLAGGGFMGSMIRAHDWSRTSMDSPDRWPQSLRTAVRLMLNTQHPMYIFWGPESLCLYNDAYSGSIDAQRHPSSLGRPGLAVWPEIWHVIGPQIEQVMEGRGATWHENQRIPTWRNGRMEDVYWTYSYSPIDEETAPGGVGGVLVTCTETTQQILNAERLAQTDARLQLALSAGRGIGTWDWDVQADRVVADERFARLYGVPADTALAGAPIAEFFGAVHPDDLPLLQASIERTLRDRAPFSEEYRLLQPDGSVAWVLAEGRCSHDADGAPLRFPGVTFDITDRKLAQQQLQAEKERLAQLYEHLEVRVQARTSELLQAQEALRQAQKMEAVGQLTGGIAHDFNNLLASISGGLQVVKAKIRQGKLDDVDRFIDMGERSVHRAAALTQRLLAFSRRQTLDPKATDVARLVAGMEDLIRRSVGPTVDVSVTVPHETWTILVDAPQLENALLNLCLNARDAMMPAGGRLSIAASNQVLGESDVAGTSLKPGGYVAISVTDTGAGMDASVLERIFEPFYTTKPIGQGTGLGLSMVYGFASQSGGRVRVQSKPGAGTTMTIELPRHFGDAQVEQAAPAAPVASGDGRTVMLIEDEGAVAVVIAEVLREAGYRVLTAHDGPTGLQVLNSGTPVDLLVTDVGLPGGLNGRQVADAARVRRADLKVLFVTGYAENAGVGAGQLEAGMEVMTKPFEIGALLEKVSRLVSRDLPSV